MGCLQAGALTHSRTSTRKPSDGSSQSEAEVLRLKHMHMRRWALGPGCRALGVEMAVTDFQDREGILLSAAFVHSGLLMGWGSPTE